MDVLAALVVGAGLVALLIVASRRFGPPRLYRPRLALWLLVALVAVFLLVRLAFD